MGFYGIWLWFNGDLMGFNCDFMGFNGILSDLPSGKRLHDYGLSHHVYWDTSISMAIFNRYVELPEGNIGHEIIWNGHIEFLG